MENQFERTELTFGKDGIKKLASSSIIVFGIGGVGSYVVEALVRSGAGSVTIVDDDKVVLSNLNRQLYALHSTLGMYKVDAAEKRILDINPECKVVKCRTFVLPENIGQFDFSKYDYAVDCIDTVSGKLAIIENALKAGCPVISSMGAGNKIDPSQFKIADIYKTSVCPLARVMRSELKKRGIKKLKCLYSTEKIIPPKYDEVSAEFPVKGKKTPPGSNAFTPSAAGLIIAGEVIRDLTGMCAL